MKSNLIPALLLALTTSGCSTTKDTTADNLLGKTMGEIELLNFSVPEFSIPEIPGVSIYRADIYQGNIVKQDMVDQLKPGMNKRQVRYVMGSPLIIDPFHQERWDYFYSKKSDGKLEQQQRITLFFGQNKLVRIEGDLMPTVAIKPQESPSASVEIGDLEVTQ